MYGHFINANGPTPFPQSFIQIDGIRPFDPPNATLLAYLQRLPALTVPTTIVAPPCDVFDYTFAEFMITDDENEYQTQNPSDLLGTTNPANNPNRKYLK